jgi:hypothetical protein
VCGWKVIGGLISNAAHTRKVFRDVARSVGMWLDVGPWLRRSEDRRVVEAWWGPLLGGKSGWVSRYMGAMLASDSRNRSVGGRSDKPMFRWDVCWRFWVADRFVGGGLGVWDSRWERGWWSEFRNTDRRVGSSGWQAGGRRERILRLDFPIRGGKVGSMFLNI